MKAKRKAPGAQDSGASSDGLPRFQRILAVVAHPDDESFGLGGVLAAFNDAGAATMVLSFTHGEASTLGMSSTLGEVRAQELAAAADVLGVGCVRLLSYPDGDLARVPLERLAEDVRACIPDPRPDALLVFDEGGITGHPDHCRATEAALAEAARHDLPVLAWTIPRAVAEQLNAELGTTFVGRGDEEIDFRASIDRGRQLAAITKHASQSIDNPVLWRRLELLGEREWLRYLRSPSAAGQSRRSLASQTGAGG
ncbi:MAG: PIG-L family deacetylase [Chloroflexota bacterium]